MTGFAQFRADATYLVDGNWLDAVQMGVRTYRQARRDRSRYLNSRAFINRPIAEFGGCRFVPRGVGLPECAGHGFPDPGREPELRRASRDVRHPRG